MSDIRETSLLSATPLSSASGEAAPPDGSSRLLSRRHLLTIGVASAGALAIGHRANADILNTLEGVLDLDDIVLNYAYEMEELQTDFFERAVRSPAYQELETRERSAFSQIAMQDRAQLMILDAERARRGARGAGHFRSPNASASMRPRTFTFGNAFRSRETLLPMAVDIKESCVAAYHGAVDLLRDKKLLASAAAVAGVDGRHLVILREIAGLDPVPSSFELQISPQTIGNKLSRYGFKGGGRGGRP